ncbi:MAG TPA: hypothetical protein VMK65_09520 [Longimicrobiales bacterium]|nr:hypothetical protein [Longimicrobiales bacterium]
MDGDDARPAGIPEDLPREAIAEVTGRLLTPLGDAAPGARLVLHVRDHQVTVRDLAAYLTLTDRIYGRLRPGGLRSYAQLGSEQLRLRRIAGAGSAVLELEEEVEWARPWRLALVTLALRVLPGVLEASGSWAEAFRSLGEAADGGAQVGLFSSADGSVRSRLAREPALADLKPATLEATARLLERLYGAESELLPAALRFAQLAVLEVALERPRA